MYTILGRGSPPVYKYTSVQTNIQSFLAIHEVNFVSKKLLIYIAEKFWFENEVCVLNEIRVKRELGVLLINFDKVSHAF